MTQHFLLSAQARTLSLAKVMRLTDEEAYETFKQIRWAANDGDPFCPRCGCVAIYEYRSCQSALNFDPLSASNIDPSCGGEEVVPVVNREAPRGFV